MVNSGEAESRAVAGVVRGANGQARLDAGVNVTGLLIDMGSAASVDFVNTSCVGSSRGFFGRRWPRRCHRWWFAACACSRWRGRPCREP